MNKLNNIREWLTLNEAVNRLSDEFSDVTLPGIYQLVLDGRLKISINFINIVKLKKIKLIKSKDVKYTKISPSGLPFIPNGGFFYVPDSNMHRISKDYWMQEIDNEIISARGVFDLLMIGAGRFDIENRYYQCTSDVSVDIPAMSGIYLQRGDSFYQLQFFFKDDESNDKEGDNKLSLVFEDSKINLSEVTSELELLPRRMPRPFLASRLDDYKNILVVKNSEIMQFIKSVEEKPKDKILKTNERNSLLILIAALCKNADIDWNLRGIATSLMAMTENLGTPLSDETIRKILKDIDNAVESRSK